MTAHLTLGITLATDTPVLQDGTLWSQAATFGTYYHPRGTLELTPELFANFARIFSSGILTKVPVDYDHGSTNGVADGRGPVVKAGDLADVAVVKTASELTEPMRAVLAKGGRSPSDANALGLWIRWRPTPPALRMIQHGEYSELSIAFDEFTDPRTGKAEGQALIAVALTNRPYLNDMVSVAASRGTGGPPTEPGTQERTTMSNRLLMALSVLAGKAVMTEEEGVTELTAAQTRVRELTTKAGGFDLLVAEIGVTDPAAAVTKVKELKATAAAAAQQIADAKARENATKLDAELKRLEKKYLPAQLAQLKAAIAGDIAAGRDTTVKFLEAMPDLQITGRRSGGDSGANREAAAQLDTRIAELQRADKNLSYADALERAERELAAQSSASTATA